MGWTITFPSPMPPQGGEICVTISGGSGSPPTVTVGFDEGITVEIQDIKDRGNGIYVVCFTIPAGYGSGRLSVSDRSGSIVQYF